MAPAPPSALAVSLATGVRLTLIHHGNDWGFGSWSHHDGSVLLPPSEKYQQQRFGSSERALAFFRSVYGARPRSAADAQL